jgi:hypothetical protein
VIIEYRDTLGGRVAHTDFGKDPNGKPYTVELGANWVGTKQSLNQKHAATDLLIPIGARTRISRRPWYDSHIFIK